MIRSYIHIILGLFACSILLASCKKTEPSGFQEDNYQKFFGGVYENTSVDMFQLNSEIYVVGDFTKEDKETKGILVVKTDNFGNRVWERKIVKENDLKASGIIPLHDNSGIAIVGTYETDDSLYYNDFFIQVLNLNGDTIWNKTCNLTQNEIGKCIGQYDDGTFVLVGTHSEFESNETYKFAIALDEVGEIIKTSKLRDGRAPQEVYSMTYDESKDFHIVTGKFPGFIGTNMTAGIFAVNSQASFTNHFTYDIDGVFTDLVFGSDGSAFVCGMKNTNIASKRSKIVASINPYIDSVNWIVDYTEARQPNYISSDIELTDNDLVMSVGSKEAVSGNYDIYVTYCSLDGNKMSEKILGGPNNDYGIKGWSIGGRSILLGTTERDENSLLTLVKE